MGAIKRRLQLELPAGQSAFLWGARKTGKSHYLRQRFAQSPYYDLLKNDVFLRYSKAPWSFREEVIADPRSALYPIIVDEIQKVPALLDEVHWLIENHQFSFILCGSSARKLKRGAANLLGGRAWRYHFFPLVSAELAEIELLRIFNQGLLPQHYLQTKFSKRSLNGYIEDYLKEEIQAEGLVRQLPQFARFLDLVGLCNTEMIQFANISRDLGIDAKTVKNYFEILVDTLLGYWVRPFQKTVKRDLISSMAKFYFFDIGVANRLAKQSIEAMQGPLAGRSFEQFIFLELKAYQVMEEQDWEITYWRTKQGLEVDFVIDQARAAIEVKLNEPNDQRDLKGLLAFHEEHPKARLFYVCQASRKRHIVENNRTIEVWPYQEWLAALWQGVAFNGISEDNGCRRGS